MPRGRGEDRYVAHGLRGSAVCVNPPKGDRKHPEEQVCHAMSYTPCSIGRQVNKRWPPTPEPLPNHTPPNTPPPTRKQRRGSMISGKNGAPHTRPAGGGVGRTDGLATSRRSA